MSLQRLMFEAQKKTATEVAVEFSNPVFVRDERREARAKAIVSVHSSDRKRPQKGVRMAIQSVAAGAKDIPGNGVGPYIQV